MPSHTFESARGRPDFAAYCLQVTRGEVPPDIGGQPRLEPLATQSVRVRGMGAPEEIPVVDLSLDDLTGLHRALSAVDGRAEDYGAQLATDVGMPFTRVTNGR